MRISETQRIRELPRKPKDGYIDRPLILRGLHPPQSDALYAIRESKGLLGLIGVGWGKTLIVLLAGWALGLKPEECLLMLPPKLVDEFYSEAWKWLNVYPIVIPKVATYHDLSSPDAAAGLEGMNPPPRLVILDEGHYIRNPDSTRAGRLHRYLKAHPEVHVVTMSGTLIRESVLDLAVLSGRSLKDKSPLPRPWVEYTTARAWSRCLDDKLDTHPKVYEWAKVEECLSEATLEAYHENLVTARGVVMTSVTSCDAAIDITVCTTPKCPPRVTETVKNLTQTWETPCGNEIADATQLAYTKRLVECGFYYVWQWGPKGPDRKWLHARAVWFRAVRKVARKAKVGIDSIALVTRATRKYLDAKAVLEGWRVTGWQWTNDTEAQYDRWQSRQNSAMGHGLSALEEAWEDWELQRYKRKPPTLAVWIDDYLMQAAVKFAVAQPCIIWYSNTGMWQWAQTHAPKNHLVVLPGEVPPGKLPSKHKAIWLSVKSHGTGLNLQYCDAYLENIVISPGSSAADWEQLIGRSHRIGQAAAKVRWTLLAPGPIAKDRIKRARKRAEWLGKTTGQQQKLEFAKWHLT